MMTGRLPTLMAQGFGAAAFWAGIVVLCAPVVAPFAAEQALVWHKLVHVLGGPAACVGLGGLLLVPGGLLLRRARAARQAAQDAAAAKVMGMLRRDPQAEVPPFLLYLRAFETTGRLKVPLFVRLRRASLAATQGVTDDLESHLDLAARGVAPLIALGRPGESIGASRIATADASWQADIDLLIRRARGVLLVPSDRPGTRWEIEHLISQGHLPKVIFVMPSRARDGHDSAARWEAARTTLAPLGLALPAYDDNGLLFECDTNGRLLQAEPLVPHAPRVMRRAMLRLLDPGQPERPAAESLRRAQRRGRRAAWFGWAETLRQLSPYALALAVPWAPAPGPEFDPDDSWATAFARSLTTEDIARARAAQAQALQADPEAWRQMTALAATPGPHPPLAVMGLPQVDDATRARWLQGRLEMLRGMGTVRCDQSARGVLADDIALTYLPMAQVRAFVEAETATVRAGLAVLAAGDMPCRPGAQTVERTRLAAVLTPGEMVWLDRLQQTLAASVTPDRAVHCGAWRGLLAAAVADPDLAQALSTQWAVQALAAMPATHSKRTP